MKITFVQEAQLEFLDAISYYEGERPCMGFGGFGASDLISDL
jgi:hypothetical protein